MDRNPKISLFQRPAQTVALRKESVDRNTGNPYSVPKFSQSLSARRAWIEMSNTLPCWALNNVALRKESVDRNDLGRAGFFMLRVALRKESVDRNLVLRGRLDICGVALRKESVDRNVNPGSTTLTFPGRSPQGERG